MSLKTLLGKSGLTKYQQILFLTVIRHPERTAKYLAKTAGVPLGRIYTELDALEDRQLLDSSNSRPKTYSIESPRTKIIRLLESERQKLDIIEKEALEDLGSGEVSAEVFHLAPEMRQSQVQMFRWAKEEVLQCVGFVHKSSENRELRHMYEKEIIDAVSRDVRFKAIYNKGSKPPSALRKLAKEEPRLVRIRFTDQLVPRLDIVDNRQILFKIQDPQFGLTTIGNIVLNNLPLARKLRSKFMSLWDDCKDDELRFFD